MATMTLTEQRLCKMWTATDYGGDWYELNKTLHEISMVLRSECAAEVADDFAFAAGIALQRAVMQTMEKKVAA